MNNFYYDDEYIRLSDEENDKISVFNMTLEELDGTYITDNECKVDSNLLNKTNKEKKEILEKILEKSYDYEYIESWFNENQIFVNMFDLGVGRPNIVDIYRIQSSDKIYDFWKMIRDGIDENINSYIIEDKVEEIFENMYTTSCKIVNEFIVAIDDFYKNYYKDGAFNCRTYLDCLESLDMYLPPKLVDEYIVSSIVLTIIEDFKCEQSTSDEIRYNEDISENDWPF